MTQPENPMPMRPYRLVFSTLDRDGNEVQLIESQWRSHILREHSEVEPYLEEIQAVIQNPELVRVGNSGEIRLARLGIVARWPKLYLRVVVDYLDENTGRRFGSVRTAHMRHRPPRGEEVI